jgi:hypothetical protein
LQTKNKAPPKTKSKVFVPDVKIARMIKGGKKPKNKITNNNNNNNQKKNQREKPPTNSKINNVVVAGGGEGCLPRALGTFVELFCYAVSILTMREKENMDRCRLLHRGHHDHHHGHHHHHQLVAAPSRYIATKKMGSLAERGFMLPRRHL